MAFCRLWLLILLALVSSGGKIFAASSEQRAFAAATAAFQAKMWNRAETEFAQFAENFPDSTNVPQAVLLEAQSKFNQQQFSGAIAVLNNKMDQAGGLSDHYIYWIGESEFASSNFSAAADTFATLTQNFPDSPLNLRATVEQAAALGKINNWPQVVSLLGDTNGIFHRSAQTDSGSELVLRGRLIQAQGLSAQNDFANEAIALNAINPKLLPADLGWQFEYLRYQLDSNTGDWNAALSATTNLLQIAGSRRDADLAAQSVALRADLFERLGQPDNAITEYRKNLQPDVPLESQRNAILKIAQISETQNQFDAAGQSLSDFLQQFSNAPAADMALLTLGELHLKLFQQNHSTNELQAAQAQFDQFIGAFTNSPLLGKAFLNRGWCNWFDGNISASLNDFEAAAQQLPPSEDLAVAKFKIGDALFAQNDFSGARDNYNAVADDFTNFPAVEKTLGAQALYQSLRANEELKDGAGASRALSQLLRQYPVAETTRNAELLYAEGLGDLGKPQAARETFQTFELQWPNSPLQPQVEFAIARTYELERDWPDAIAKYQIWLAEFQTNALLTNADYSLAWVNSQAGDETNALALFQNFVARFPANNFAPQAQWWIASHFYNDGNFSGAETNYAQIYQNWPDSDLAYPARLMTGRAALGRGGNSDAINYFKAMIADTNCPPDLNAQARFAAGLTVMNPEFANTNNPVENFQLATNWFSRLIQVYPANELALSAQIKIADCNLQMNSLDAATNAYAAVFTATNANISLRSEAQIGFGIALEKMADTATADNKTNLLQSALNSYLDVFYENNLRDDESADPFWTAKAGLQALSLVEKLGVADPKKFIDQMEIILPQMKDALEKKRAELSQPKS